MPSYGNPVPKLNKRDNAREGHLVRKYGITLQQYNKLLEKQNHCCGVCKRHRDEFKTNLAVDHDHKSGAIRGLLCISCNRFVIGRHRDPQLMYNAYEYLSQHTGWFVPKKKKKPGRRPKPKLPPI